MRMRGLALAALGAFALATPVSAQIIATSIPREDVGGGTGAGENRFALHLMASPFAKWKINSYVEEPKGDPTFVNASSTDSSSKFIGAAELAFAVSEDVTIGVGGWYNTLGEPDVDVVELDVLAEFPYVFTGIATQDLSAAEFHANVFYKNVGVQFGLVRTSATLKGLRAGSSFFFLDEPAGPDNPVILDRDFAVSEFGVAEEKRTAKAWDAFLVYKYGGRSDVRVPWAVSLGAGVYRDTETSSSAFSGFATASLQLFRGLGIDASYWYVGSSKPTEARQELGDILETTLSDNLSRFTIGVGYSWPN